ncbi:FAD-linked oxidase C-terminal domain-containing protein [Paracidobacterium acidisoli]|uniref:FAD-binding protein n=1 Tax=Paracidobacterium acidisoli TaxID=2303751 RepID=A0A372IL09_9BACT|nr:FAD-linked oxidase C-terminal domain-containing protein [Paracidobacterium acidisoli]MBT9332201.1 FAD-binding protein [Paracidobacterium acidisoli]
MLPASVIAEFETIVGTDGLIVERSQLQTYECDGLTAIRTVPSAVVLPRTAGQVQKIVRLCSLHTIPFVARGAGTGLSGGALPAAEGIVISFARMTSILSLDLPNQRITVQPGVINSHVTRHVSPYGYFYAPDPSSQSVCTIGGNVAENSGGAHCLKYGFTTTHVLGLEIVTPTGDLMHIGAPSLDAPGYDLTAVFVGSEGTLGVATAVTLRIVKKPEVVKVLLAAFDSITAAGQTVSDIIAASILPSAMEIMDRLSIVSAEAAVHPNYPQCEALLLVELDGPSIEAELQTQQVHDLCRANGAWEVRLAQSEHERMLIWKGRKAAFAAAGRLAPNYIVQDGVIPRTRLPEVLEEIGRMAQTVDLRVSNVFHAGDGNLHPIVLYDASIPGQEHIAVDLSLRILRLCVDLGGSITGEHGVGKEKQEAMGYMFSEPDLDTMQRVRCAFDPQNIANPDKLFPRPRLCGEKTGPYTPHPLEKAGVAEFF